MHRENRASEGAELKNMKRREILREQNLSPLRKMWFRFSKQFPTLKYVYINDILWYTTTVDCAEPFPFKVHVLSPFSTTRICSHDAKQNPKSGILIGQQKKSLQNAFSLANHVAEFVVRTNKFAQWKTGFTQLEILRTKLYWY